MAQLDARLRNQNEHRERSGGGNGSRGRRPRPYLLAHSPPGSRVPRRIRGARASAAAEPCTPWPVERQIALDWPVRFEGAGKGTGGDGERRLRCLCEAPGARRLLPPGQAPRPGGRLIGSRFLRRERADSGRAPEPFEPPRFATIPGMRTDFVERGGRLEEQDRSFDRHFRQTPPPQVRFDATRDPNRPLHEGRGHRCSSTPTSAICRDFSAPAGPGIRSSAGMP